VSKAITALFVIGLASLSMISCKPKNGVANSVANGMTGATTDDITRGELLHRTQELFDAVSIGNQVPWQKYFADDCMYFDEKGANKNKDALIADVTPLPPGYSGSITLGKAQSHIEGDVAILSYDLDEKETIYGQNLTARYHATDTWMRRNGDWRIIAGQVLRFYEDPAPGKADIASFARYVGTYELAPTVTLTISKDGGQLFRQRGDRAKEQLIPEASDIFFRKGVEGRILFPRATNGKVESLIDRRNNEDVVWKKLN
jgi:hypothetical protein